MTCNELISLIFFSVPHEGTSFHSKHLKSIFAFEEIDGYDICFFSMYVTEYISHLPNSNKIYISTLDSVKFFKPKELRTKVYYEIILGYLQHAKNLG